MSGRHIRKSSHMTFDYMQIAVTDIVITYSITFLI